MNRRELFEFQKERIEHIYAISEHCGQHRVVIVADMSDELASKFASIYLGKGVVESANDAIVPTRIFALENEESLQESIRRFFPRIATILVEHDLQPNQYFVLILSDSEASIATHVQ